MKDLAQYAANKEFTHLVILTEKQKECNGLLITHLPCGPTAFLKVRIPPHLAQYNLWPNFLLHVFYHLTLLSQLSSFKAGEKIPGHGRPTNHIPEIILNNFVTRLGRRTGRFLGSLFPHVCFSYLQCIIPGLELISFSFFFFLRSLNSKVVRW